MSEHKVIIHRGVAELLLQHFGKDMSGNKTRESDGECGCGVCKKAAAAEQQVLNVMGPCPVAVLVGYEVLPTSSQRLQQRGTESYTRVVACFKLRRLCSHISSTRTGDALSLDCVLKTIMECDDDIVRDLRSVRAALPYGVKIVGLAVSAKEGESERVSEDGATTKVDEQLRHKQLNQIANKLRSLINKGDQFDDDGGVRFLNIFEAEGAGEVRFMLLPSFQSQPQHVDSKDMTAHFCAFEIKPDVAEASSDTGVSTGLCTKHDHSSGTSEGKPSETFSLHQCCLVIEDLRGCWQLDQTHIILRSRLPINIRLSSSAYAAILEQDGLAACCCPKGLLCPSLPPETAEEIVQQLQQQDALLLGEDALFFQMPDGSWIAPITEAGINNRKQETSAAKGEISVAAALKAAKKSSKVNAIRGRRTCTPTNIKIDDGEECLEHQAVKCWGMLESKWADCTCAVESLRRDGSLWIPVSRRSSNQIAGSVVAGVICQGNSEEDASALWSPGTSVLLPEGVVKALKLAGAEVTQPDSCANDLQLTVEAHRFAAKENNAPYQSLLVLEVMVLVETSMSQNFAAERLLHAFLDQLRYIGACLSYMALQPECTDLRGGLAPLPRSSSTSLATQTTAVHLSLLCDGLSPRLSLSFHSFLPEAFAVPISVYAVQTPQLRVSWMDLCAMSNIKPTFVPQRALRPLGSESSRLISPHSAIAAGPKWMRPSRQACVKGDFEYFHYLQDGEKDEGWGCCYRALQTVCSWYRLQGYTTQLLADTFQPILSISDVQRLLKKNDPAFTDLVIGSGRWIGTLECLSIVGWYLGFGCRVLHLQNIKDILSYTDVLLDHFQNGRAPVVMGIGQYAYTMVGIATNSDGEIAYLIVDPHYTGDDDAKIILEKGWVSWKKVCPLCILQFDFLEKTANSTFVNILLPHTSTEEGNIVF